MRGILEKAGGAKALIFRAIFVLVAISIVTIPIALAQTKSVPAVATTTTEVTTETITIEPTTEETTEEETTTEVAPFVNLSVTTLQNDLRIRFYDRNKKLVKGEAFEVMVKYPNGEEKNHKDEDKDGRINLTGIPAGKYKITLLVPDGYEVKKKETEVTVKDKVEYNVVSDVKDDIKKESEVDLSKEQAKPQKPVEQDVLKDTVDFVTSSKTEKIEYVLVPLSEIDIPEGETTTDEDATGESGEESGEDTSEGTSSEEETSETSPKQLKDKSGNALYLKDGDSYKPANDTDFSEDKEFYKKVETIVYTGWQNLNGKTYYYDKNGNYVTGNQVINGAKYSFDGNGVLKSGFGVLGIDVSTFQRSIDWEKVKLSGINFAIIRCGFRGYGTGAIVEDNRFKQNIAGAKAAGIDIGIYFYSQAINEAEAVEEASACIALLNGQKIKYPIYIDIENTGTGGQGRADGISKEMRTKVAIAFCETIKKAGYTPGVYSNKNYFLTAMDMTRLNKYNIWLAHYTSKTDYTGPYNMWQYSAKGTVAGIQGEVDMNLSYMF